MSEVKEAIITEAESEGDDTEELVSFHQNGGNLSHCQVTTFPSAEICDSPWENREKGECTSTLK